MTHRSTISVSEEIYRGLQTVAGQRTISEFFEELARPVVIASCLEALYKDMILNDEREREATERIEALVQDSLPGVHNAPR
jgi:hypothetical protein